MPRPDPLSVWPRSARRAFSAKRRHGLSFPARGGTALSLFFQRAELPSLSPAKRRPVLLSPPGAALPSLPRQRRRQPFPLLQGVQLPFLPRLGQLCPLSPACDRSCSPFPPEGGTGLALCPERKRASALFSPSAGRGDRAAPRQKQKARPPPKGWPDRCVSLSGDEAQVSDQALGLPNWQSLLPESEVHISSMFRGSL